MIRCEHVIFSACGFTIFFQVNRGLQEAIAQGISGKKVNNDPGPY